MLSLHGNPLYDLPAVPRRQCLRVGALGAGLSLPRLFEGRSTAGDASRDPSFGRAKSCILCFLFGAPAHQDIWDLKPLAPSDVRGEFSPIDTSVPGISLGEHVPHIARTAHRLSIVRSVSHPDNTHTVAMHYMLTGHRHLRPATNPRNQPDDFPTFGAVMQRLRSDRSAMPSGVSLNSPANQVSANNHIFPGFFAGWLGSEYDPLFISQDPAASDFQPLPYLEHDAGRSVGRRDLRRLLDSRRDDLSDASGVRDFNDRYERAYSLVTSNAARDAFDLSREPASLRDRYGRSAFGQSCLLARRLVEAGVSLVTVNWARDDAFWDTHAHNFRDLKEKLLPPFDAGFSTLVDDLAARGLLDETLVVCLGEFGRTPKINGNAGRDHWAPCNSVVLAGAGVRGGVVHGSSDRLAAYPATFPVSPDDLAATIYHSLGIDRTTVLHDRLGRPSTLSLGRPLLELF